MSIEDRAQPVEVNVGPCRCAGGAHTHGDIVYLKPEVDVPMQLAFSAAWKELTGDGLTADEFQADMQGVLGGIFLRHGISGWTFTDEEGTAIRVKPEAIRALLSPSKGGLKVVDRADDLYSKELFAPLVAAAQEAQVQRDKNLRRELRRQTRKSSPAGPMESSTHPMNGSGSTHPEPSVPSSRATSAGMPSTR